tara:strand:+ start:287 stop:415 length:129 start_codon:yes stop_codon:yes gene_type:complete
MIQPHEMHVWLNCHPDGSMDVWAFGLDALAELTKRIDVFASL